MHLTQLTLTTFRNLAHLHVEVPVGAKIIAVLGPNGAGKTSVLEALSLLSPGRGLHKAKAEEMLQISAGKRSRQWGIYAELEDGSTIGQACQNKVRKFKINGQEDSKQADLATIGNVIWLTPRQDRLFLDGAAVRRETLDRFAFGLIPAHAEAVARYKHHTGARLKLLKQNADPDWVELEEQQAAEWGIKVLENRRAYLAALSPYVEEISLYLTGATLSIFEENEAGITPLEALKGKFERSRQRDAEAGATHTGAQRVDLAATLHLTAEERDVDAAQASSGQHKRVLMQLILAHVRLMNATHGRPPLVLMDEIAAHLDAEKRAHLLGTLTTLGAQIWLTETEQERLGEITPDVVVSLPI